MGHKSGIRIAKIRNEHLTMGFLRFIGFHNEKKSGIFAAPFRYLNVLSAQLIIALYGVGRVIDTIIPFASVTMWTV